MFGSRTVESPVRAMRTRLPAAGGVFQTGEIPRPLASDIGLPGHGSRRFRRRELSPGVSGKIITVKSLSFPLTRQAGGLCQFHQAAVETQASKMAIFPTTAFCCGQAEDIACLRPMLWPEFIPLMARQVWSVVSIFLPVVGDVGTDETMVHTVIQL